MHTTSKYIYLYIGSISKYILAVADGLCCRYPVKSTGQWVSGFGFTARILTNRGSALKPNGNKEGQTGESLHSWHYNLSLNEPTKRFKYHKCHVSLWQLTPLCIRQRCQRYLKVCLRQRCETKWMSVSGICYNRSWSRRSQQLRNIGEAEKNYKRHYEKNLLKEYIRWANKSL